MPKSVLIIDPLPIHRIRLSALLEGAQYAVVSIDEVAEATRRDQDVDLVVLGLSTAQAPTSVQATVRAVGPDIPVLCFDADPTPLRRLLAIRSGVRDVLPRDCPDNLILARLRSLLREGEALRECERRRMTAASFGFAEALGDFTYRARIECVGVGVDVSALLGAALGHDVEFSDMDGVIREAAAEMPPDVYVFQVADDPAALDLILPELRDRNYARHAPVLVIYPQDAPEIATRALALGATDIVPDPSSGEEFALRIDALLRLKRLSDTLRRSDERSHRLAATDHLTGLYNRRYAETYLGDLMMRMSETGGALALMVVDLDHFKRVNDRFGHTAGDTVLREVADRLRDNLRACDLVSRHGGEEFLVVLPDTSVEEAMLTADRLRRAISERPVMTGASGPVSVTASIGVAPGRAEVIAQRKNGTFDAPGDVGMSISTVFSAADTALYRAKGAGRNRVELSDV
jgi:two-component system cell cycle response regulator